MSRSPHRDAPYWVHSAPDDEQASDAPPCPGRCNRAWRNPHRIDETTGDRCNRDGDLIEPRPGQPIWCRPCAKQVTDDLAHLPDLAVQAASRVDGRLNAGHDTNTGAKRAARTGSPSGSPAFDIVDQVASAVGDLVDELAEHLDHTTKGGRGSKRRVSHLTTNVAYLEAHATALLCAPFAVRAGREITQLARLLEHAGGMDRLRHRLPAPCPSCDRMSLVRDDGSEQVDCTACGARWPESDYRRLTLILASDYSEGRAG